MSKTHKQLFKSNREYRNGARKMIAKINPIHRSLLLTLPEGYRFVTDGEEFCKEDFYDSFPIWEQTGMENGYCSLFSYITRRSFNPQPKETFAELKKKMEGAGFVVEVGHVRKFGFCNILPKGGSTFVWLIKNDECFLGKAHCNPAENFCKETGRLIALKRAIAEAEKAAEKSVPLGTVASSCEAGGVMEITQIAPRFKVGDYVSYYKYDCINGPCKVVSVPQENVIEILYSKDRHVLIDTIATQVWLSGTTPPQKT